MDGLYQAILDREELKRLQDQICTVAGVYAFCVDHAGTDLTDMSGNERDRESLVRYAPKEELLALFRRVSESSLEDQAIEETEIDALKYAAVSVKADGRTVMTWLVYGVLSDAASKEGKEFAQNFQYSTTEDRFNYALDLLREISGHMVEDRIRAENAKAESHQNSCTKEEMEYRLMKAEATAKIVQASDKEAPTEEVLADILAVIGRFLRIDRACLYSVGDGDDMDVCAEWCDDGIPSGFERRTGLSRPGYLYREKPLVFSLDSGREGYGAELERAGIKAFAAFPILWDDRIGMYACFEVNRRLHNWEVEEIRFLSESVKLLQRFLSKRRRQEAAAGSYAVMEDILYNVAASVYVRDQEKDNLLFANKCFKKEFPGETEQDRLFLAFESKIPEHTASGSVEIYIEEKGCWYHLFYQNITWTDGRPARMYSICDITVDKMCQGKMRRQAYTDAMTGAGNRRCCELDLAKYVKEAKKAGQEGALLCLGLEGLQQVNDSLGHQYSDALMQSIVNGVRSVRGIHHFCYRMGEAEIAILVPPDKYEMLDRIVEEVKTVFQRPCFLAEDDGYCTMGLGIVHFPSQAEAVEELLKKADIAMCGAKKSGKNQAVVYDDSMKAGCEQRLALEKKLYNTAMGKLKGFEVYYQPIVDARDHNACIGAEALIRWNSAEGGAMSLADCGPLAEYLGLGSPIGSQVLQQACAACKRWNDNGHSEYRVYVKLSRRQLQQADLGKTLTKIIKKTKINPRHLVLEIPGDSLDNDLERIKKVLARIRKLKVQIALDDFGTGYFSWNHIKELSIDTIKIDQSLVRGMMEDTDSQSFIKIVSDYADTLGRSVCVKGVDTQEQCKMLQDMKVGLLQGDYFGEPMHEEAFAGRADFM